MRDLCPFEYDTVCRTTRSRGRFSWCYPCETNSVSFHRKKTRGNLLKTRLCLGRSGRTSFKSEESESFTREGLSIKGEEWNETGVIDRKHGFRTGKGLGEIIMDVALTLQPNFASLPTRGYWNWSTSLCPHFIPLASVLDEDVLNGISLTSFREWEWGPFFSLSTSRTLVSTSF